MTVGEQNLAARPPPHPRCHMSTGRNSVELETTMTQKNTGRNSCHGGAETNRTRNHEVAGLIPGLAQGFKDLAFFRELWHKVSDVARIPPLLWLWLRLADAAPIQHQACARAGWGGKGSKPPKNDESAVRKQKMMIPEVHLNVVGRHA